MTADALVVDDLDVTYRTRTGPFAAVRGFSLSLAPGETVALVGESGSGKSSVAGALLNSLGTDARTRAARLRLGGTDLSGLSERRWRDIRGRRIGFIAQDPGTSLDPVQTIGRQVAEAFTAHGVPRREAQGRVAETLARAGLPRPEHYADLYPHQLSGGLRQRVLIAIAIANRPEVIIADEPTSALDVTTQRRVLDQLERLGRDGGSAVLLITHDLGVALDRAQRVVVMQHGRIVEQGDAATIATAARHPYTIDLFAAAPSLSTAVTVVRERADDASRGAVPDVVLRADGLVKTFGGRGRPGDRAVDDVSFQVERGRTLSIVGESGSGKTTTARIAVALETADAGRVVFTGRRGDEIDVATTDRATRRELRRRVQFVHQNPYSSLNPLFTVGRTIEEPLKAFRVADRAGRRARVAELLDAVALPAELASRRPAELSGGQRQRVAIARALALEPELLVLDEPVSALDVRVQAQVLRLLARLQEERGLSYLFISHDLAVVRQISDRVVVMAGGAVVEEAEAETLFRAPATAYTRELIAAIPGGRLTPTEPEDAPALVGAAPAA